MRTQANTFESGHFWPHARRLLIMLAINGLPLFLAVYGLKCILTLQGKLTEAGRYVMGSFYLVPVKGDAAIMTGFGDIFLAIFAFLSSGLWPSESRAIWYRIGRGIIRWGSLAATFYFWHAAHNLRLGL